MQEIIEQEERAGRTVNSEEAKMSPLHQRMDIDDSDIIITGATNTRISRQQVSPFMSSSFEYRY